jgi:hypothetical protein
MSHPPVSQLGIKLLRRIAFILWQSCAKAVCIVNLTYAMLPVMSTKKQIEKWFQKARRSQKDKDEGLQAGREYVDAYVKYELL